MESNDVTRDQAAADLAALQTDRGAVADRARQPWWYDPALGLLVFGFFSSYSFGYPWVTVAALIPFFVGIRLLMVGYQRHTGFWVSGLRGGRTQRAVRVWLALCVVVLGAGLVGEFALDVRFSMVVAGAVLGVAITLISRWWTTIYQRELRGEQ